MSKNNKGGTEDYLSSLDGENGKNAIGTIPMELMAFFKADEGHSLIIKGAPGCGKTTLSLQISHIFKEKHNAIYFSGRTPDVSLTKQFPWMKGTSIICSRGRRINGEVSEVDRTELRRMEGFIREPVEEEEEEEGFLFNIGTEMPEMDQLYEMLDRGFPKKGLVIIDSIDSLSELYGIEKVKLLSMLQKDLVENSNVDVIFILESSGDEAMDYLGDGVIDIKMDDFSGRKLRRMELTKLRGVEISNQVHYNSLYESKNTSLSPPYITSIAQIGHIKMGWMDEQTREVLEKVIKRNTLSEFCFSGYYETSILEMFITKFIEKAISRSFKTVVIPHNRKFGDDLVESFGSKDESVMVLTDEYDASKRSGSVSYLEGRNPDNEFESIFNSLGKERSFFLVSLDRMKEIYGDENKKRLKKQLMRRDSSLFLYHECENEENYSFGADLVFKMNVKNGVHMLFFEKPFLPPRGIFLEKGSGKADLIPMV